MSKQDAQVEWAAAETDQRKSLPPEEHLPLLNVWLQAYNPPSLSWPQGCQSSFGPSRFCPRRAFITPLGCRGGVTLRSHPPPMGIRRNQVDAEVAVNDGAVSSKMSR